MRHQHGHHHGGHDQGGRLHGGHDHGGNQPGTASTSERPTIKPDFAVVYREQRDYIWRSLRRMAIPGRYLEDVAHDVLLVVHQKLDVYDPNRPIKPWLFAICFRVASDWRRKAANTRERLSDGDPPGEQGEIGTEGPAMDGHGAERALETKRARSLVMQALSTMAEDRRAVFILHEIDGETVPVIADALNIPLNTAYSRLRLSRKDFSQLVSRLRRQGAPRADRSASDPDREAR